MKNSVKSILLVEDNPDDEELALLALKNNKVLNDIVVARDGREALDFMFCKGDHADRDENDLPQIVILDLKLPEVDGLEVLREIRANERTRFQPVVILTTSSDDKDILASYQLGVNSYIKKPIDFKEFDDAMRHLGLYWLSLNIPPPLGSS